MNDKKKLSTKLTEIKKARLYEHNSPTPGMGQQCFYDFIHHKTLSVNFFPNKEDIDMIVHNGPTLPKKKIGFTSYRSNVWGDQGNGFTKFMTAPIHFDYESATAQDLIENFDDLYASLTIENVQLGKVYLVKVRGGIQLVAMKIVKVSMPGIHNHRNGIFLDSYFDFEYKYYQVGFNLSLKNFFQNNVLSEQINIQVPSDESIGVNTSIQLNAHITPKLFLKKKLVWKVNDGSKASITQDGILTTHKPGCIIVTVTAPQLNLQSEVRIMIHEAIERVIPTKKIHLHL